jgi:two-component system chemotaxis sensor kinase CheA
MARQVGELRSGIESDERRLTQVTADIEDEVRRTRMLSVSSAFDPMHRLVRDLARDLGKDVVLEVEGGDTEVDRSVLEQIRSPLTHLIRNAVDHGIEDPQVREAAGKPRRATIRLAATQRGGSLMLAIADDGSGLDVEAIRHAATRRGLVTQDQLRIMSERDILRLIFRPSFSTTGTVTDISGRGVGLDVVRETVERLNGMVDVASESGAGTTFTLSLPLSVATTQALLVQVSGMTYALPIGAVSRIVSAARDEIGRAQGREMIVLEDGPVVLVRLEDVLQLTSDDDHLTARRPVIVIGSDERRLGIAVDALIGTQDVVVKPLPRPLERVRHVAGATVLASGDVVVVLNTSDLVRSAVRTAVRVERILERPGTGATAAVGHPSGNGSVMVVDDSIVTRMLEKSILEAAGYTVHVAADGVEAIRALQMTPVDLVVSDVNMPNMDGLVLTQQIRADTQLRHVPIILVTSLDSPDDQVRGMEAGADAYIVKSSFSQEGLLETVGRLITIQRSRNA